MEVVVAVAVFTGCILALTALILGAKSKLVATKKPSIFISRSSLVFVSLS